MRCCLPLAKGDTTPQRKLFTSVQGLVIDIDLFPLSHANCVDLLPSSLLLVVVIITVEGVEFRLEVHDVSVVSHLCSLGVQLFQRSLLCCHVLLLCFVDLSVETFESWDDLISSQPYLLIRKSLLTQFYRLNRACSVDHGHHLRYYWLVEDVDRTFLLFHEMRYRRVVLPATVTELMLPLVIGLLKLDSSAVFSVKEVAHALESCTSREVDDLCHRVDRLDEVHVAAPLHKEPVVCQEVSVSELED